MTLMREASSTTLYRFFDASGRLLYVGISGRLFRRLGEHAAEKVWWGDIASVTVEHFGTREDAAAICPNAPLDLGIAYAVKVLRDAGVETFESCEGGEGHAYLEPTVRFHGTQACGWKALTAAMNFGLPVKALRRTWPIYDGGPNGPYWEMTFR